MDLIRQDQCIDVPIMIRKTSEYKLRTGEKVSMAMSSSNIKILTYSQHNILFDVARAQIEIHHPHLPNFYFTTYY